MADSFVVDWSLIVRIRAQDNFRLRCRLRTIGRQLPFVRSIDLPFERMLHSDPPRALSLQTPTTPLPMAYSHDYKISARRHFRAAEMLCTLDAAGAQPGAKAVAGYLYGLTGELAVKQLMLYSGMRPLANDQRRNDPFYKHFPELKTFLLDAANGRRSGELLQVAQNAQVFQEWNTDMRYAPTKEVTAVRVDGWQQDAKMLIEKMEEQ